MPDGKGVLVAKSMKGGFTFVVPTPEPGQLTFLTGWEAPEASTKCTLICAVPETVAVHVPVMITLPVDGSTVKAVMVGGAA